MVDAGTLKQAYLQAVVKAIKAIILAVNQES